MLTALPRGHSLFQLVPTFSNYIILFIQPSFLATSCAACSSFFITYMCVCVSPASCFCHDHHCLHNTIVQPLLGITHTHANISNNLDLALLMSSLLCIFVNNTLCMCLSPFIPCTCKDRSVVDKIFLGP